MGEKLVLIGAGGFAREVLDLVEALGQGASAPEALGFVVDAAYGAPGTLVNDLPILGGFEWLEQHAGQVSVVCAVGAPAARFELARRARQAGCRFMSLIHPSAILTRWVSVGEGVVIGAGCVLTNRITIGDHAQVNLDCTIGHDATLHRFATLAPGVHVSGNVALGTGCYIGTGANLIENIVVGEWSIIGAGSAIIKDVPPNATCVGVPGKVIKTRPAGWHLAP
jgi:sugar O-acyltransferase (sialic acid O-acetyltransferase NeuD family)